MERLDKVLAGTGRWSRREVKLLVRQGQVQVNGAAASSAEEKVEPETAVILVGGEPVRLQKFTYVMLHKPAGVLSATEDRRQATVLELLPQELRRRGLSPVGPADAAAFAAGLTLEDGLECLPAGLEPLGPGECIVTLREGKFHQVKRMLAARGAPVLYLKRLSMGPLALDGTLAPGAFRELTAEETAALRAAARL